jgi:hypothetical protein
MLTLSFDVGYKNLSYCKLASDTHTIVDWNVCAIPSNGTNVQKVTAFLFETFGADIPEIDAVLVEKQPARNVKMRLIETMLLTFFATHGVRTVLSYSAKHKLGSVGKQTRGKKNYSLRKKTSVLMCSSYLEKIDNPTHVAIFQQSKKKDDLADALLQYLSYIHYDLDSLHNKMIDLT